MTTASPNLFPPGPMILMPEPRVTIISDRPPTAWRPFASFRVYGTPKGQPRPRAFARKMGAKFVARVYEAGTAEEFKSAIAIAARPHLPPNPLDQPIRLDVVFLFPRPQCLMRKKDPEGRIDHLAKPDRDNLDKACLDALTQIGFWRDDAKVCAGTIEKFYVAKGERPGAEIRVSVRGAGGGA